MPREYEIQYRSEKQVGASRKFRPGAALIVSYVTALGCGMEEKYEPFRSDPVAQAKLLERNRAQVKALTDELGASCEVVESGAFDPDRQPPGVRGPVLSIAFKGAALDDNLAKAVARVDAPILLTFDDLQAPGKIPPLNFPRLCGLTMTGAGENCAQALPFFQGSAPTYLVMRASVADSKPAVAKLPPFDDLSKLHTIEIQRFEVDAAKLDKLLTLAPLRYVELSQVTISGEHRYKARPSSIRSLTLSGSRGTRALLPAFSECRDVNLAMLDETDVDDETIARVLPNWPRINILSLRGTKVTQKSVNVLLSMKVLDGLDVGGCAFDKPSLAKLRAKIANLSDE